MKIKRLKNSHAAEYQNLILEGVAAHPESFRISVVDVKADAPPFEVEQANDFTLGAFDKNEMLVGVVSFERERREKLRHKGLIYRMYVRSTEAGKGVGRKLLRAAIERAREIDGLEQINLTVVATNERAKRLYESEGFVAFSHEKQAIKIGAEYFDEETMALHLTLAPKAESPKP